MSVALVFAGAALQAQTTEDAKKALDAEQYTKAISALKQLTTAKPAEGVNYFLLGQAYLRNDYPDSAKAAFQRGAAADPKYAPNFAGLGTVELENGNAAGAKTNFDLALSKADGKKDAKPNLYVGRAYLDGSTPDYKAALPYLQAAALANPKDAEVALALGVAHRGAGDNSAAYADFSKAIELDKTLTRAKMEQAISVKLAKAYKEAEDKFNEIIAADPNYAPVYRELAENYYQWFNATGNAAEADAKIKLAAVTYAKYMDRTDRSVEKRLRYADYLLLAKDYKALETEANVMAKMDKANLRTLRYLGYSAFENGNYQAAVQSLTDFMAKVEPKRVIPRDHYYLGRAQLKAGNSEAAVKSLTTAIKLDSSYAEQMSPIAKDFFAAKQYDKAASFYDLATLTPKAKLTDFFYVGYSNYFDYKTKYTADTTTSKAIIIRADSAFSKVIQKQPSFGLAYLMRARITRLVNEQTALAGAMVPYYEKYVEVTEATGTAPTASDKQNLIESYNNLGAFYANTDKAKAKTYWDKTLALDPANVYATEAIKQLATAQAPK